MVEWREGMKPEKTKRPWVTLMLIGLLALGLLGIANGASAEPISGNVRVKVVIAGSDNGSGQPASPGPGHS